MKKNIIINALKIIFVGSLIYWLISSGKLDFRLIAELTNYPQSVALAAMVTAFNFVLISYRWKTILRARSQNHLPLGGLLKVNWIGQFFSSVLPGSVTGDLVKILYIKKLDQSFTKKFIFASILIDRAMGLSGLILLVGISSLLFGKEISSQAPSMKPLLQFNYVLMSLVILTFTLFFFFHHFVTHLLRQTQKLFLYDIMEKLILFWDDLVLIKRKMFKGIIISILVQLFGVIVFWILISPFVDGKMNFFNALASIPIGLMTLALPIAPSGLGVGHAIFQKIFELSSVTNGASLFNIYFVVSLVVNLLGAIPYMTSKTK